MRLILIPITIFLVVTLSNGLPVIKHHDEKGTNEKNEVHVEDHGKIHKEVEEKFAGYDPHLRTKWDEERRVKLEVLRQLYNKERELENGEDFNPFKHHEDGDPVKIHAGEIAEVKKSIAKIIAELTEIDHKRRELFKEYEMQKKFNERQKEMGNGELDEQKRKQYHEEQEKLKEKHKKHEPLHHPGSKQQMEEVWEKQDHINQEFDPAAFFNLHDMDGNGVWDQDEVKSLFKKELDKMYQEGLPEDDLYERVEEMERMREHVFKESDLDRNGLIDFNEFSKQVQEPEKDEGWKGLDEQEIYTQEDYDNYVRYHQEQRAAQMGNNGVPPHPNSINYQQVPHVQQHGDPNLQYYPGQVPQYQQPQGQQVPIQHQQQIPVQQQHPPQYQQQHQVPNPQQYQMPPQYVPRDQIPVEQQYHHQMAQQAQQQPPQNIPNHPSIQQQQQQQQQQVLQQQPPQNIQTQQHVQSGNVNAQAPIVHNTQNQEAPQQLQQQQPLASQQQQPHLAINEQNQNLQAASVAGANINHV